MIRIMYANHCASNDYITNILFHVQYIYIYIPLFHVLDKWNAYEKVIEDLHKASVHELNNGVI
jgi:hypothetical protein